MSTMAKNLASERTSSSSRLVSSAARSPLEGPRGSIMVSCFDRLTDWLPLPWADAEEG
jgi:hypothetical protein